MGSHYSICCNEEKFNDNNINYQINITQNINEIILKENNSFKDSKIKDIVKISNNSLLRNDNKITKFFQNKNTIKSIDIGSGAQLELKSNIKGIESNYYCEKLKKNYCIKINLNEFMIQDEVFNYEKNLNNFSNESLINFFYQQNSFLEDEDIMKLFDEWNQLAEYKNQKKKFFENKQYRSNIIQKSNASINENIFLSNTTNNNNNINYMNHSTHNKSVNEIIRNSDLTFDLNFFPEIFSDKDNTLKAKRLELFPVYPDLEKLDKIYYGEWSLNLDKLESLIKSYKEDRLEIRVIEIKNLNHLFDFDGSGILIKKNTIFEGVFKKDFLCGPGRIVNYIGYIFKGIFENGNLTKNGIFENKEKNRYEGEFKNNKMNGYGKETFFDGSIFTGFYKNNIKNGKGKFIWADKSIYEGDITNNELEGFGNFVWQNGIKYIGEWRKGKMEGKGILDFNNGEYFEGFFKENKKHGKGKYVFSFERYFEGNWSENIQVGEGLYVIGNKEFKGFWKESKIIIKKK